MTSGEARRKINEDRADLEWLAESDLRVADAAQTLLDIADSAPAEAGE